MTDLELTTIKTYLQGQEGAGLLLYQLLLNHGEAVLAESLLKEEVGPKVFLQFDDLHKRHDTFKIGPCRWFQVIFDTIVWSLDDGSTDVARRNEDGTWDARPPTETYPRTYTGFLVYADMATGDPNREGK